MDRVKLKNTYSLYDFFMLPLRICPVYTVLKMLNKVLDALVPTFGVLVTADFVDTALGIRRDTLGYHEIYTPVFFIALIVFYKTMSWPLMNFVRVRFEMELIRWFRAAVAEKRAKLEYRHIENNESRDLITRVCRDPVKQLAGGYNNLLSVIEIVLRVVSLLAVIAAQVWWAAPAAMVIAVPLLLLSIRGGRTIYQASREAEKHKRSAEYLHTVLSGRDSTEERSMFGYTDKLNREWYKQFEQSRKIELKYRIRFTIKLRGSAIVTGIITFLVAGMMLLPLSSGDITVGMFMGITTATFSLVQMMTWQLCNTTNQLAESHEFLSDFSAFSQLSEKEGALSEPAGLNGFQFESIELKNVTFRYPGTDRDILKNLSLRLEKNLHYAFVGVNGAGKTTIAKLLCGLYDNYEGDIEINGKNMHLYSYDEIKAMFSVVFQDFARYGLTLRDNIALGGAADDDRVLQAIQTIGLEDTVRQLKDGWDTPLLKIDPDGTDLSGGQWQRVAIARALAGSAPVRILDEPTASLDPVAESGIYEMFGRISAGHTTLFITHRLGATKLADEIIVIDDGRVAERGTHSRLMEQGGLYAGMYESQRSWYQ